MKLPVIKEIKKSTSLPIIKKKYKILSEDSKKELLLYTADSLANQMNKIKEIKIFLNNDFHKGSVDFEFLKDIENEYAEQYLTKLGYLPTKSLVKKIISLRPIESCDFLLSDEILYINDKKKDVKVIHIYPSSNSNNLINYQKSPINKVQKSVVINKKISLKNIESVIKIKRKKPDLHKEVVNEIKNNNIQQRKSRKFNRASKRRY